MLWAATLLVAAQAVPHGDIVASSRPDYGFRADRAGRPVRLRDRPVLRSGTPESILLADEYPPAALREMRQGIVHLRFVVRADGRVSDCIAQSSDDAVGPAGLRAYSCAIVARRARFFPARDSRRQPVSAMLSWRIVWTIPEGRQPPSRMYGDGPPLAPIG